MSYSKNCFRISIGSELQYAWDSNAANQNETQIQLKSTKFKFFSAQTLIVKKNNNMQSKDTLHGIVPF